MTIFTLRTFGLLGRGIWTKVLPGLHSGSCLQMLSLSPEEQVCGDSEELRSDVMERRRGGWLSNSE